MKNLLFGLMALISFSLFAQDDFEGTITYDMTYSNMPTEMQQFSAMLPKQTIISIKGDKSRIETPMAMGTQAFLIDQNASEYIMLMDMMGMRKAVTITKEDSQMSTPEVTYHDEYKTIAGYKCQKATVITLDMDGNKVTSELYFTEEIPNVNKDLNFVKGLPLQYSAKNDAIDIVLVATSVEKKSLSNNLFVIPEGFEPATMDQLQMGK